jgi:putative GTP pyrophosphokinase
MSDQLTPEQLKDRAVRFYARYGDDLNQIKNLLDIHLSQLAYAYTIQQKLPREALTVKARVKTLDSFLKKLERKGWPQFYYPTEVAGDLVAARVVCWFVDDCTGFLELLRSSPSLRVAHQIEDYIAEPKASGYRSIHLFADVKYDGVRQENGKANVTSDQLKCEIQIRTKLQDAWGDVTHEFHYKAKNHGVENREYEGFLCDLADRLANEDRTLIKFRNAYQRMADEKLVTNKREGFRDD